MKKEKNLRYSLRIGGRVTSVYIKKSIIALFIVICCPDDQDKNQFVQENIYDIVDAWKYSSGKGLSEYVTASILGIIAGEYSSEYYTEYERL